MGLENDKKKNKHKKMKTKKYFNSEDKPILSLERARELLPGNKISDEELQNVLLNIQQFCEMTYDIYLMNQKASENKGMDESEEFPMAA